MHDAIMYEASEIKKQILGCIIYDKMVSEDDTTLMLLAAYRLGWKNACQKIQNVIDSDVTLRLTREEVECEKSSWNKLAKQVLEDNRDAWEELGKE
jgi:hypothetical protein